MKKKNPTMRNVKEKIETTYLLKQLYFSQYKELLSNNTLDMIV